MWTKPAKVATNWGNKQLTHFASWFVLRYDFVPSVTNIYILFIRHVYSCWKSERSYNTQSGFYQADSVLVTLTILIKLSFCLLGIWAKIL